MTETWINHLISSGAQFHDGSVTAFADQAQTKDGHSVAICDLSHEGVIAVSGVDAVSFLHAQLTNDVLALTEATAQWNGWCSPKGRLLTTMLVWRDADTLFLMLPKALQAAIQKRLTMFVLRAKVKIEDANANHVCFGVIGANAGSLLQEHLGAVPANDMSALQTAHGHVVGRITERVIRLNATQFVIIASPANAVDVWKKLQPNAQMVGANAWELAGIRAGIIAVRPETQDMYVPQMVNFELINGVNFKKGCYPGQEIVARTQYRGVLKRRMVRVSFAVDGGLKPTPGTNVYSPQFGDQAAGSIALAALADNGMVEALVVTQLEAIKTNSLFLDQAFAHALTIETHPYLVPEL